MKIIVFLGPSLDGDEARCHLQAEYRPPAAKGDVYDATLANPKAIALVDGYFHNVPSVWHKELLWAMTQGIHVFGAASMGALRAAELHSFGMIGVGQVFEAYLYGSLTDDDEVALLHSPPEFGAEPLTESMINIRATLTRATEQSIIPVSTSEKLCAIAKQAPYWKRTYSHLLEAGRSVGLTVNDFEAWLVDNQVDVKGDDARLLLRKIKEFINTNPPPYVPQFEFHRTRLWEQFCDSWSS